MSNTIREQLFLMQESVYRDNKDYRVFQARILAIEPESIIGVRTPPLRRFARTLQNTPEAEAFMRDLPHRYHEEKQLHSFLAAGFKEFDKTIEVLDGWLPYIDNWASCDSISPKVFAQYLSKLKSGEEDRLMPHIDRWLDSGHCFTVRFGILCLMKYYLGNHFTPNLLHKVAAFADSEEYYIRMMVAWYLSFALVKQWETTLPLLQSKEMCKWTHNKTIQKAVESFRISDSRKTYLKSLKI